MITIEQSQYLLNLTKKVEVDGILQNKLSFNQVLPFQRNFILISPDDTEFSFLYKVNQSQKNQFKLTLYLMDDDTKIGLLRVDYNGPHENPHTLTEAVPKIFHPYVSTFFKYNDHHIHYYVEGYKTSLDWALPLTADTFPTKSIKNPNDILGAFFNFNQIINLITEFKINPLLI